MKRKYTFLIAAFMCATLWSQSPEKMSYQAIIRNSRNQLVINKTIGMQISILQDSASGTTVYVEKQTPITNANGLVSIEIGGGTLVSGNFSTINWANGPYFVKTETDPDGATGGISYTITGTSQLLSVPYALYANIADTVRGTINYTETQSLSDVIAVNSSANGQIKNVTDPTDAKDAATKAYVDALITLLCSKGIIVKDIDGNIYSIVRIDSLVWMAENLKTTKYNDGTDIQNVTDANEWMNLITGAYCWYNNDANTYKATYGALYNWYTVNTGKLCPTGWHVPRIEELSALTSYGGKLKETGTAHWLAPNAGATNETGFTALPGGWRQFDGTFGEIGTFGCLWSTSFNHNPNMEMAYFKIIYSNWSYIKTVYNNYRFGISVRCIKD